MAEHMKKVATESGDMNIDERNWFSNAYRNVVGSRRGHWRSIIGVEQKEEAKGSIVNAGICKEYRVKLEAELTKYCQEALDILHGHLIKKADESDGEPDARVYYYKMAGDYNRYMAEYMQGEKKEQVSAASLTAYQKATEISDAHLAPTNPIRLGLALNFSVYYFEIQGNPQTACKLAQTAFDLAMAKIDTVSEEMYKESTLIMHLLRDNLTLWTSDMADKVAPNASSGGLTATDTAVQAEEARA